MDRSPTNNRAGWTWQYWRQDLPASLIVFLVAMPLCMGVALASGAPITTGLVSGVVGGIVVGFLSGAPLQVSGPAAGLTVIVYSLIQTYGIEKLGVCVLAAGILQLVAGYFRFGQWFRAVSPAVIQGMLAGIGILIFASQFHVMLDDQPHEMQKGWKNLITIPQAVWKSFPVPPLGSTADRTAETQELQLLGILHLQQREVGEEVHHLLSGIEQATQNGPPPDAVVDTPAEESLVVELNDLADRQSKILISLSSFQSPKAAEHYLRARNACQAALTDLQEGDIFAARNTQDIAEEALDDFLLSRKNHGFAAMLGALTIICIIAWKGLPVKRLRLIPAALVAVLLVTLATYWIQLPVLYVEVPINLGEEIFFPSPSEFAALLQPAIWVVILQLAIIGSAETLLCAAAIDRAQSGPRANYDRALQAQGVANIICGLLCALPVTGGIVRGNANLHAGAQTRLSTILHGVWLLIFVCLFAGLLRFVPTATLAAVMVYTGYKLIDFRAFSILARRGRGEVAIYLATAAMIVVTDLLTGVVFGLVLSIVKLVFVFTRLEVEVVEPLDGVRWTIRLRGSATFLRLPALADALDCVPPSAELQVDVSQLDHIDAACLDLLEDWRIHNEPHGAQLIIDAESLSARFWRRRAQREDLSGAGASNLGAAHRHAKQRPI
ncbi:MAG TPA: SulP family inorganic anion transporter [Pirellulaceae bacterium]|nr:SulP family inorganic anion transporter [Pirellulaceae bacterium]